MKRLLIAATIGFASLTAQAADIRITRLEHFEDSVVERYATVLLTGLFSAAYLQIGLGREHRR